MWLLLETEAEGAQQRAQRQDVQNLQMPRYRHECTASWYVRALSVQTAGARGSGPRGQATVRIGSTGDLCCSVSMSHKDARASSVRMKGLASQGDGAMDVRMKGLGASGGRG